MVVEQAANRFKYDVYERKKSGYYIKIKSGLPYDEAVKIWRRNIAKRKIERKDK